MNTHILFNFRLAVQATPIQFLVSYNIGIINHDYMQFIILLLILTLKTTKRSSCISHAHLTYCMEIHVKNVKSNNYRNYRHPWCQRCFITERCSSFVHEWNNHIHDHKYHHVISYWFNFLQVMNKTMWYSY